MTRNDKKPQKTKEYKKERVVVVANNVKLSISHVVETIISSRRGPN